MSLKIWLTHLAVYSLQKNSSANERFHGVNVRFLEDLNLAQTITYWERVTWSPLLRNNTDREAWEAYASQQIQQNNGTTNICYVCGEGMEVGSPDSLVDIPGEGSVACSILEAGGLKGLISSMDCSLIPYVISPCQCRKATPNSGSHRSNNLTDSNGGVSQRIFRITDGKRIPEDGPGPYSPIWEAMPSVPTNALMYDQMSDPYRQIALNGMINSAKPTFSRTNHPGDHYQDLLQETQYSPMVSIFYPVFDEAPNDETVIGSMALDFPWASVFGFSDKLPLNSNGLILVIESNHGQQFTFKINDQRTAVFLSNEDTHDRQYDGTTKESTYDEFIRIIYRASPSFALHRDLPKDNLMYNLRVYPSDSYKSNFVTNKPAIYATVVALIFVFTSTIFILYDVFVRRREARVMESANQANAIVTSLFPESVKIRLMRNANVQTGSTIGQTGRESSPSLHLAAPKQQLQTLLRGLLRSNTVADITLTNSQPIADFFPNVTVIFADIAGFTAWSSEREPTQVFQLLESVYQAFDTIAASHGVFKVETIGDCYVAVTGLPEPQDDHAVRMARFAHDIILRMHEMASSLESLLGPGTSSLSIRVGLHSGSVTGGVLRGDKARFQLFGDTMNTAARMQSTGEVGKIQATDSTAGLLREAGYLKWVAKRDTRVFVKGKGDMQTFWIDFVALNPEQLIATAVGDGKMNELSNQPPSTNSDEFLSSQYPPDTTDADISRKGFTKDSLERLVSWNTDLLEGFLKKIVAGRSIPKRKSGRRESSRLGLPVCNQTCPIDDVTEIIAMSSCNENLADEKIAFDAGDLPDSAREQLRDYVGRIARMYRHNPFHNFEHASHVAMSASKIVKRIIKPEGVDYHQQSLRKKDRSKAVVQQIHHSTFGISSDTLMQFAAVFSAVVHDVDHTGVPNNVLVHEADDVAVRYGNKSAAEQHSIRIAWDLLMEEPFEDLRACIFTSTEEKRRFYQLIVNAVIATDIADAELQMLRKNRWNKAFYDNNHTLVGDNDDASRKATVVFEYIIQASDVAHTMQHWHVYCKWNERLFEERYDAYLAGRDESDPSLGWYNGEIWFFDNYVIPLARKLETCGVFGVSSDEYLNYAIENRHEWERKGHDIVQRLREKYAGSEIIERGRPSNGFDVIGSEEISRDIEGQSLL